MITITLVVPIFPPNREILRCRRIEEREKSVIYTLLDGTICCVYLFSEFMEKWYPESERGWYLKIKGEINICKLKFIHDFLRLYGMEPNLDGCGVFWHILYKLGVGLACEDYHTLQEGLIDALALKEMEKRSVLRDCADCYRGKTYGPLSCKYHYIINKTTILKLRRKLRHDIL